jgi:hypothetical protein
LPSSLFGAAANLVCYHAVVALRQRITRDQLPFARLVVKNAAVL